MNIVVIGFKGAGKSTLSPLLAEQMGFSFDDLDRRVMEKASALLGERIEVRDAFRRLGAASFREMECELLAGALEEDELVLALGGGAALDAAAPDLLRECCVVYLRVPEDELISRIERDGWPAYLDGEPDPREALRRLLGERLPHYESLADVVVDVSDSNTPAGSAELVYKCVQEWMEAHK